MWIGLVVHGKTHIDTNWVYLRKKEKDKNGKGIGKRQKGKGNNDCVWVENWDIGKKINGGKVASPKWWLNGSNIHKILVIFFLLLLIFTGCCLLT